MLDEIKFNNTREKAIAFSLYELEGMQNQITKRDVYSNKVIEEMLDVFLDKDYTNKKYLKDNFIQLLDYTIGALEKIAKNPKMKLHKISELQDINKVSRVDFNTMIWLSSKPGKTIAEKVGVKGKILAPKNQYTVDKKENRVVNYYFKKVYQILENRYKEYRLDQKKEPEDLKKLYKRFFNIRREFIKNGVYELKRPLDFEPNNTLIDHRDYSIVNRGLNIYNNLMEKEKISLKDIMKNYIIITFFKCLNQLVKIDGLNFVNESIKIDCILNNSKNKFDIFYKKEKFYKIKAEFNYKSISFNFRELIFDNEKTAIKKTELENKFIINFELLNRDDEYLKFTALNKEYELSQIGVSFLVNDIISNVLSQLENPTIKKFEEVEKLESKYINFVSKIPMLNQEYLDITLYDNTNHIFLKTDDFHYLKNEYQDYNAIENLSKFIKTVKSKNNLSSKNKIIYPATENIDTDDHKTIHSVMNSNFKEAYPVWRSVLASYFLDLKENYLQNNKKYTVLDLNILKPSLNIIMKKNGIYEHHPALEFEEEKEKALNNISLYSFLKSYLYEYSKKYTLPLSWKEKEKISLTGKVYDCIFNNKKHTLLLSGRQILLEKDNDIFIKNIDIFKKKFFSVLKSSFQDMGEIIIISDYLENLNTFKILKDRDLSLGKDIILDKIENSEVVWNEYLPNLSLETISNHHFYELNLINNESIDLTLGKEKIIEINEELILPANNSVINFPLFSKDSFNKKNYSLEIKSEAFPLEKDLVVELKIGYSYSNANPYRIIIEPKDKNLKLNIKTKWIEQKKKFDIKTISFPEIVSRAEIDEIKRTLENIENAAYYHNDEKLKNILKRNKNRVRRFIAKKIDEGNIDLVIQQLLPKKESVLINKFINLKYTGDLRKNIKLFLSSFGSLVSYIIPLSEDNKDIYGLYIYRFSNLKFSKIYTKQWEQIKKISEYALLDRDFMGKLINNEKEMLEKCLNHIRYQLKNLNKDFDQKYQAKLEKPWELTNEFRDSLEFILSILTVSSDLFISNKHIQSILNDIKSIDRKIQIESKYKRLNEDFNKNIRVKFELEKTDDLNNMSDLAYAVYNLITGTDGSNAIKISSLNDEEN